MLLTVTQDTGQPPKKTYLTQNVSPAKLEKLCATTIIKYRKKQGMELSLPGKNLCCFKYQKKKQPIQEISVVDLTFNETCSKMYHESGLKRSQTIRTLR